MIELIGDDAAGLLALVGSPDDLAVGFRQAGKTLRQGRKRVIEGGAATRRQARKLTGDGGEALRRQDTDMTIGGG